MRKYFVCKDILEFKLRLEYFYVVSIENGLHFEIFGESFYGSFRIDVLSLLI